MSTTEEITVHGYPHGGILGEKPRIPMVHILASDEFGRVHSISFHPVYAESLANSIVKMAKAARAGRKRNSIKIKVTETIT